MNADLWTIRGNLVDLERRRICAAEVEIRAGRIIAIRQTPEPLGTFLLPGFVDAHVHVESSMLTPAEFARAAVVHGTVATVSDPHEIANVLGTDGIEFMLANAATVPLKICFGVPSCVPATEFETSGACLDADAVERLLDDDRLGYLSEMMNYPGVLAGDPQVLGKIAAARRRGKPVDGHAPGLRGARATAYVAAGITTDHECTSREEALDKLAAGCQIQIRQGSAARNFAALHTLIDVFPTACMFCSDDKHPDDLREGHIDLLVRQAVAQGQDPLNVLRCACLNPVEHYRLDVGRLRVGDWADFIEVADLTDFRVLRTFIQGQLVAERGRARFDAPPVTPRNQFVTRPKRVEQLQVPATSSRMRVIEAVDGELFTKVGQAAPRVVQGLAVSDPARDLLKLTVVNRYADTAPAVAFIRNFGLSRGAIASSVSHDCHNVVAVGVSDDDLCQAVNLVIEHHGGLALAAGDQQLVLPLPVAGLMSTASCAEVADRYRSLNAAANQLGSDLRAPFMTLAFMALLVIPALKLSDQGLFDVDRFELVPLFLDAGD